MCYYKEDIIVKEKLGDLLKQLRKEKKLTQEDLSRMAHISKAELINLEKNRTKPNVITLHKLSKALGYSYDKLFKATL